MSWFPKTGLPDISVQLLALDGVAVNPIQYEHVLKVIFFNLYKKKTTVISFSIGGLSFEHPA